jgi:phosphoribosylformylglycinamidine synthase
MIHFFGRAIDKIYAVNTLTQIPLKDIQKLEWLLDQKKIDENKIDGLFIGPRSSMISPWSTNAVEISQNMGVKGVLRIELYEKFNHYENFDLMLNEKYYALDQSLYKIKNKPEEIKNVLDINLYNKAEGLALNYEEIKYLEKLSIILKRPLTDSEVFGFSQVNSEHCRHKIFNGTFIIDNETKSKSLFQLIKKTSKINPNSIISAYKDNVAFVSGPIIEQFSPSKANSPSKYVITKIKSVISLKAETHNFPTTVEAFNGAATGSGGEIRDRMAGGQGSIPLSGSAVYMTPYSRVSKNRSWEDNFPERPWRYQSPLEILIKASNGASDFGNKFGQPLINGSLFTFEHKENEQSWGYDKVIMLAGGVGTGKEEQAIKKQPKKDDLIVILGGDNYRIGMGGAAVSSSNTGSFNDVIELNAIQRSNPEMQKRVSNTIRSLVESKKNPIISIHDHGAGGHLNCLSELVEENGGTIQINKLPIGDPTLSFKELIGNESQERMGLIIHPEEELLLRSIAYRERAPIYVVGKVRNDHQFTFIDDFSGKKPIDLHLSSLFGKTPKTIMKDKSIKVSFSKIEYSINKINDYLNNVLRIESVACKDWLTNKVDRCVTGKVAQQQTVGEIQLPLSNCGVVALDYSGTKGIATSIGHSPISGLIDSKKGSINAIAESLTNIIWAPIKMGIKGVSLSANWMWPCNSPGEDSRLYDAVEACSEFAISLGINIPTGKDSLSMKQQYKKEIVTAPGTVIISAAGECLDVKKTVTPDLIINEGDLFYINISQENYCLGGSVFGQTQNKIGITAPGVKSSKYFIKVFNSIQDLILKDLISAGHDISSGGLITSLLEMCFPSNDMGLKLNLNCLNEKDTIKLLFSENSGILIQSKIDIDNILSKKAIDCLKIGSVIEKSKLLIKNYNENLNFDISNLRDVWFSTSVSLDYHQTKNNMSLERKNNYKNQILNYVFPGNFNGKINTFTKKGKIKAAVIREQGSNSEREMAYALHLAGFEVIDVHMTDLIEGRENLEDIKFIAAVGGFSNSDVLGSAKGWAGSFLYNNKAKKSLENFFKRENTMSIGVCNGCQLFIELNLINPLDIQKPKMLHNNSEKFECHFTAVTIQSSSSIMMKGLEGSTLGIWAAHGEGKFYLPMTEDHYQIPAKYHYDKYPANPNGSDYNAAMLNSKNGRHLVMMPHLERSTFPWNWGHYPKARKDEITPWINAFNNAYDWLSKK